MSGVIGGAAAAAIHHHQRRQAYKRGVDAARRGLLRTACNETTQMEREEWHKGFDDFASGDYLEKKSSTSESLTRWQLGLRIAGFIVFLVLMELIN